MKNETLAVIMATVIVLAFLAGLGSSTILLKGSGASQATSSSTILTTCTIPDSGEVIMQVLNSTDGRPIASAPVQVEFLEPVCPPNPHTMTTLSPMMTNGTGYVAIGGEVGDYTLSVSDYGYSASASVGPGQIACITLGIPGGETHVTYTGLMTSSMCRFGF
jgi:hypothetical protein